MEAVLSVDEVESFKSMFSWWNEITPNTQNKKSKKQSEASSEGNRLYIRANKDCAFLISSDFTYWVSTSALNGLKGLNGLFFLDFSKLREEKVNPKRIVGVKFDFVAMKAYITYLKTKTKMLNLEFPLALAVGDIKEFNLFKTIEAIEQTYTSNEASLDFGSFNHSFCRLFNSYDKFVFTQSANNVVLNIKSLDIELEDELDNSNVFSGEINLYRDVVSFFSFMGKKVEISKGELIRERSNGEKVQQGLIVGELEGLRYYSLF